ncbi:MAG: ABC transporter substrate-binding protein [Treponema sp.]|jgi:polar amino acid transport system substrate-binding protein|nr:ABC transporter substrate-binding protein [Treponema sp.]
MNNKKTALLGIVLILACLAACQSKTEKGELTLTKGVLMIGMEIGYPPMEYYDEDGSTPIGFDVEMGKAIAAKMGLEARFIDTGWDGIFAGVETSRYDCIMSSVTITPERQAVHNFSKPYIGNAMAIVTLKNSSFKPRNPQELTGLGVSYQAETTAKFFMAKLVEDGLNYTAFEYDKVMSCFDELELGRVDVIVTDSVVALDYTTVPNSIFEITWLGEPDEFFGICIKKGNNALTNAIDKALDELFADGTMKRISERILNIDMVSSVR